MQPRISQEEGQKVLDTLMELMKYISNNPDLSIDAVVLSAKQWWGLQPHQRLMNNQLIIFLKFFNGIDVRYDGVVRIG